MTAQGNTIATTTLRSFCFLYWTGSAESGRALLLNATLARLRRCAGNEDAFSNDFDPTCATCEIGHRWWLRAYWSETSKPELNIARTPDAAFCQKAS